MKKFKTVQAGSKQPKFVSILLAVAVCGALTACATPSKTHRESASVVKPQKKDKQEARTIASSNFLPSKQAKTAFLNQSSIETTMPRGGGYEKVGKPYRVNGKWYYPQHDAQYAKTGRASWYGPDFHGKKTANGEIFDMNHLSAAHPTMPLPSYARVTNLENGSSVVVRINDRGPFAKDRIIDLSKRAAQLLNYHDDGVADVKVEYIGRAPVDDDDDAYLLASYQPGRGQATPQAVMLAQADKTPKKSIEPASHKLPGVEKTVVAQNQPQPAAIVEKASVKASVVKPVLKPNSYAAETAPVEKAVAQPAVFSGVVKPQQASSIALGTFKNKSEISSLLAKLNGYGTVHISPEQDAEGYVIYRLTLSSVSDASTALQIAQDNGAINAYLVQD